MIPLSGRRPWVLVLCLCLLLCLAFSLFLPTVGAAQENGSIRVFKSWQSADQALPETVQLHLMHEGSKVSSIRLSAANADSQGRWVGSFDNTPLYSEDGRAIPYTVAEEPLEGFQFLVLQQPRAESIAIQSWGEKVTPASSSSYSIGSANLLAANKGGSYYVWTRDALGESQRLRLLSAINEAGLQGFGKSLSLENTQFASSLPASFPDGVSLRQSEGGTFVDFERTSVWSLFYAGSYEQTEAKDALTINRAVDSQPSPSPVPSAPPSPSASPAPSNPPVPPATGDEGMLCTLLMMSAALLGFSCTLYRLKLQKGK